LTRTEFNKINIVFAIISYVLPDARWDEHKLDVTHDYQFELILNPFVCMITVVKHALVWRPLFPFTAVIAEQLVKWGVAYIGYAGVRMIRYTRRLFKLHIFSTKHRFRLV